MGVSGAAGALARPLPFAAQSGPFWGEGRLDGGMVWGRGKYKKVYIRTRGRGHLFLHPQFQSQPAQNFIFTFV